MTTQVKRSVAALRFVNARHRSQELHGNRFARALGKEFAAQGKRVAARYLKRGKSADVKAPAHAYLTAEDLYALIKLFGISEAEMYVASAALTDELLGVPAGEPVTLPKASANRIASRVKRVDAVTRRAIRKTVLDGITNNLTDGEIAENLRDKVASVYKGRAETIARTEMALIDQEAAHDRYKAAGLTHVRIYDGSDCGWTSHDDPDKANGTIRTIDDARAHPLAHPNCVRASAPEVEV